MSTMAQVTLICHCQAWHRTAELGPGSSLSWMQNIVGQMTPPGDTEAISKALGDASALVRERALLSLERAVRTDEHPSNWIKQLQALWMSAVWQQRLGGLTGAKTVLTFRRDDQLEQQLQDVSQKLLADEEPRVRLAAGECLGLLAKLRGLSVWTACRTALLDSIYQDYDRDAALAGATSTSFEPLRKDEGGVNGETGPDYLGTLLQASNEAVPPGKGEMRHGTEGWRCLETSFKAMLQIMENSGSQLDSSVDAPLIQLVLKSLHHPNRFVRETCYHITALICNLLSGSPLRAHALLVAQHLRDGLSENWSQVRFAACVATRAFMQGCEGFREDFYPLLLPHMCLNRYDVAEGVRTYSQATWVAILGQNGRSWIGQCFPQVLDHYTSQAKTNNPAVREAACTCLAEAAAKVDAAIVEPHLQRIMRTLLACFRDDAWPVRSAACRGCGRVVRTLPEASRPFLPDLWPLWIAHLDDNIPSVREDAAIALGDAAAGLQQDALSVILPHLRATLPAAHQQPQDLSSSEAAATGIEPGEGLAANAASITAWPGPLVRPKRTGGVDYSCGCMDYGVRRPKEPWEASNGAVYLMREVAAMAPAEVAALLPQLASIAALDSFAGCRHLQETIWRQLPSIASSLGKRPVKPHLAAFLPLLFAGLTSGHQLCEAAAGNCLGQLRDWLGPNIFASRLSPHQERLMLNRHISPPALKGQLGPGISTAPQS
ncbi:hypothetical protein WJX74_009256 [Apatococcus lobatus]|uniref:Uncharacterized protein n=1 Tax=Apatococcus lobatus TaxID=904363 RepID=A0AAW1S7C1_9CHLO